MASNHPRAQLRAALRAAFADVDGRFAAWAGFRSWGQDIDDVAMPAYGIFTPREVVTQATGSKYDRSTDIVIQLRRTGGEDIDDDLDDDSAEVEALVLPVLRAQAGEIYHLASTDIDIRHSGGKRIGVLNMTFRQVRYTPEGQSQ